MVKQLSDKASLLLLAIGEIVTMYTMIMRNVGTEKITIMVMIIFGAWTAFVSMSEIISRVVKTQEV
jgi:hypothetical protein